VTFGSLPVFAFAKAGSASNEHESGIETGDNYNVFHRIEIFDCMLINQKARPPRSSYAIPPYFWGTMEKPCNASRFSLELGSQGFKSDPRFLCFAGSGV